MRDRRHQAIVILLDGEVVEQPVVAVGSHLHKSEVVAVAGVGEGNFVFTPLRAELQSLGVDGVGGVGVVNLDMDNSLVGSVGFRLEADFEIAVVEADVDIRALHVALHAGGAHPVFLLEMQHGQSPAGLVQAAALPLGAVGKSGVDILVGGYFLRVGSVGCAGGHGVEVFGEHCGCLCLCRKATHNRQ